MPDQPCPDAGQTTVLLVGILAAILLGALVLGGVARGLGERGDQQRTADLSALAAARALQQAYPHVFEPAQVSGLENSGHLERAQYLDAGRRAAEVTAKRNGAKRVAVSFPQGASSPAPTRVRVEVLDGIDVGDGRDVRAGASADAELVPAGTLGFAAGDAGAGEYPGPYAYRTGKPMRPDVAQAFDRMAAAAAAAEGHSIFVVSGYRSNAEQAVLFAAHPDPKWVAPPGQSMHRLGTELDLGPASAYGWIEANASRFHFVKRYAWEPWHFGYTLNAGSTANGGDGVADRRTALPSFVPARYAPVLGKVAQRWNISAALLAAQLWQESGFNPFARSAAGALGIAQFMPGTAAQYGLGNPFDAEAAINAQAHLMRDLLRQFGSVPLALAAYNAGPGAVQKCGCIPPYPETQAYVAAILGLLHGAGDPSGAGAATLAVRLVR